MAGFGFGPNSTLAPMAMGTQDVATVAPPSANQSFIPGPQSFDHNGATPPPPPGWSPSAWAVFSRAMSGNGDLAAAKQDLTQQHIAQLFAQKDAELQAAAMAGKTPELQFAIHHDPSSFSTNANQTFGFHNVAGGDTAVSGGQVLGTPAKTSAPAEMATAANGAVTAAAASADAATKAGEAANKALMTPAQILHLDRTGQAALIAARKQPAGAVKPGAPKPTGRVF
jgi:hypothetical protein